MEGVMKSLLVILSIVAVITLSGCARVEPTPDVVAVEATVAQRIFATLTASAPTVTSAPSATPVPTTISPTMPTKAPTMPTTPVEPPTDTPVPPPPTATFVPAPPTPEGLRATVQSQALNVRAGPGTSHPIVATLKHEGVLQVTGRNNDGSWFEVTLPDDQIGWVSASLVELNVAADQIALAKTVPTAPPSPPTSTPAPQATAAPAVATRDLEVTFLNPHYDCQKTEWGDDPPIWGYRSFQVDMYITNRSPLPVESPWKPKRWIITDGGSEYVNDRMWQWVSRSRDFYEQPVIQPGGSAGWTFLAFPIDRNQWVKAVEFVWNEQVYRQEFDLGPYGNSYNYKDCGFIPSHTERPTPTPRP